MTRKVSVVLLSCALALPAATLTASAAQATTAAHKAALTLGRSTALPGAKITFRGAHFRAREKVELHWASAHGSKLTTVTASRSGAVSGHFAVPNPKAGSGVNVAVVAVGSKDHKVARARFTQMCTDEWAANASGDWSSARKWSTGAVPGSSDIACITRSAKKSYTVSLTGKTGSTTVGSLLLGSSTGSRTETLKILPQSSDLHLDLARSGTVERRGVLALGVTKLGGNVFIDGGPLHNFGDITTPGAGYSRYFSGTVVNEKTGTFLDNNACNGACDVYFNNPSVFTNLGSLKVAAGATVITGGATINQSSGSVVNDGSIIVNGGSVTLSKGTVTGNAWMLRNGVTLNDHGASGTYTFHDGGTFNGNVPAGQTLVVDGDAGGDVKLAMPVSVTNDGTIDLTSDTGYNGQTNSWLVPQTNSGSTLTNHGLLETTGVGYSRYIQVDVVNASDGRVVLGDADGSQAFNYLVPDVGSLTLTNEGSLTIADGANLTLSGVSAGQANFTQTSTGVLHVTQDSTHSTQSLLAQLDCSASGCQDESVKLGGTINVTTVGSPATFKPVTTVVFPLSGQFSAVTGTLGYSAAYSANAVTLTPDPH